MAIAPIQLSALGTNGFVINGPAGTSNTGWSVASAGDINGDGFDDLVIGSNFNNGSYVVFGQAGAFAATVNLGALGTGGFAIPPRSGSGYSGISVASAGDVNGDGLTDLLIGAAGGNGEAYVVFGATGGFGASLSLDDVAAGTGGFALFGPGGGGYAGWSVASAGDINGDGFDDVVVGAPYSSAGGGMFSGEAFVVFGKAGGFGSGVQLADVAAGTGGFVLRGIDGYDFAGRAVASAGDLNGDGLDDLVIGARLAGAAGNAKGQAGESYVVFGRTDGFAASISLSTIAAGTGGFVIHGADAGDRSGRSVASAGDVNGDGFADLIIGAYYGNGSGNAANDAGDSYVVFGKAGGFGTIDLATLSPGTGGFAIFGQDANDASGFSVASAGDLNADGFDDLIIGARGGDGSGNTKSSTGDSYVVFGKAGGWGTALNLSAIAAGTGGFAIFGVDTGDQSGHAVAAAGDLNGDGFDDLIIGAPYADGAGNANADVGDSYVILGRDFLATVTHAGTTSGETLTGTAGADSMVGGQGNDILEGNGGADVLVGGSGDDTLRVSDLSFARIAGGTGTDTLALMGSGMALNLGTVADTRLQEIERIDLTGSGNNTLRVTALEVLNLSSTSNTLRVLGNAGDVVMFNDAGWVKGSESGGFVTWSNGQARLEIATAVTRSVAPFLVADLEAGLGGFVLYGEDADDVAGFSVASAGDINGDGFDDLIIGARDADAAGNGKLSAGGSYVVFGKASGFGAPIDLGTIAAGSGGFVIHGEDTNDGAGRSVASAGDLNGDGFADLVIGARGGDGAGNGTSNAGGSYVVFGKASGFTPALDLSTIAGGIGGFVIHGENVNELSGQSVASAGDVNGDGFDDLVIGAPYGGKSYVVFGKAGGFVPELNLSSIAAGTGGFVILEQDAGDFAGWSVASAGDVNGDGLDDLIIGTRNGDAADNLKSDAGDSYVVFGRTGGFPASLALSGIAAGSGGFVIHGADPGDAAGRSVASAGDLNGDGFADLIVGARNADGAGNATNGAGDSYVVFGQAGGFGASVDLVNVALGSGGFVIHGSAADARSGFSVASAGDVNGDGFDDLIIGAYYSTGGTGGASYVVFGKAGGWGAPINASTLAAGTGGFAILGKEVGDRLGYSVASAGDVDGDGFDDLIVGASRADAADNAKTFAGESYVVFGRDFLSTVTHAGTASGETLTGTAGADSMVGGQGHDTLEGGGGADVLVGGAGDDTLRIADLGFARAMGGSGTDTLALTGSGTVLNLAAIADTRLQDIEQIDLTGSGNNTLRLTRLEVLNLSSTSNTLRVLGNAGDAVAFDDSGWVGYADIPGFTTWSNGQARVEVAAGVSVPVVSIHLSNVAAGSGGFVILGKDSFDNAGYSVASAGDINGDGFDDLLIGARGGRAADNLKSDAGETYVVFGKAGGFGAAIDLDTFALGTDGFVIHGADDDDASGFSVAAAGDVNGDGFADIIIGAPDSDAADNLKGEAGGAYVVFGKAGGFAAAIDLATVAGGTLGFAIHGADPGDRAGSSVASAGDINGDGLDDLLIGAPAGAADGNAEGFAGETYVVFGQAGGFNAPVDLALVALGTGGFVIWGEGGGHYSGTSVASAGDIDGDGFDDLVIGAPKAGGGGTFEEPTGEPNAGFSYVVFGKAGGFAPSLDLGAVALGIGGFVVRGAEAGDRSGFSVSSAGDLNGDGFADLLIGASYGDAADNNTSNAGESYVVFGKAGGFGAEIDLAQVALGSGGFVIHGQDEDDRSGFSVAAAGDVNGDGFDDLIIGAFYGDGAADATAYAGDSYLVFGNASGWGTPIDLAAIAQGIGGFAIHGQDVDDSAGWSVAGAGDIDGDGFDDLIVGASGAWSAGNAREFAGESYVIFGRDFSGAVTHAGTEVGETLTGTAGADRMVGGRGGDSLAGGGGADVLVGGEGDDTFELPDLAFARVMGGSGSDVLVLTGAGMALDLAAIADTRLQDIEEIDLEGTGDNTLRVTALEVLNLSSTSNTLRVHGNAGDLVVFDDAGWVRGADIPDFTTWSNGQAVVEIAEGVLPCYAPGTRIATPFGWRAVETLRAGDAVLTADGEALVLTWTGAWDTDAADPAHRAVRIRAHAFGPGRPARDLVVSPSHALWLDGTMVPAAALLDGVRVVRDAAPPARYHHLALAHHAAILAEDLPAETFCPLGEARYADAPAVANPLPRLEEGAALEALRTRLGLAPRREAGPADGFLERILPVTGGIIVEGWASGPAALDIEVDGWRIPVIANRWRIDLDRAGLAAGGFRQFVPLQAHGRLEVRRAITGEVLPALR